MSDPTDAAAKLSWDRVRAIEDDRVTRRRQWLARAGQGRQQISNTGPRVGLALSGGGIRSATFSVGVLRSLSRLGLMQQVDYLSTVSGGGYAGAFYGSLFIPGLLRGITPELDRPAIERVSSTQAKQLAPDPLGSKLGRDALGRLREGGHYLMPAGTTDTLFAAVVAIRNWIAVSLVTGTAILFCFLAVNLVRIPSISLPLPTRSEQGSPTRLDVTQLLRDARLIGASGFGCPPRAVGCASIARDQADRLPALTMGTAAAVAALCSNDCMAATPDVESNTAHIGASYLWLIAALTFPLWLLPCAWAYWMTRGSPLPRTLSDRLANGAAVVALLTAAICAGLLAEDHELRCSAVAFPAGLCTCAGALLGVLIYLASRQAVARDDAADERRAGGADDAADTKVKPWRRDDADAIRIAKENRIRAKLSRWLYRGCFWAVCIAALALADDLGGILYHVIFVHSTHQGASGSVSLPASLSALLVGSVVPVTRWLLTQGQSSKILFKPTVGPFIRRFGRAIALLTAVALLVGLTSWWSALAHEIVWHDRAVSPTHPFRSWAALAPIHPAWPPVAITAFVGLCAMVLGNVRSFLNQSSLASFYAGRLRKAYLGATNDKRAHWGSDHADREHPKDDIDLRAYYHPDVLAPLHLINITVNETTAQSSNVIQRDRKGKSMTISPAGFITTFGKPTDDPQAYPLEHGEQLPLSTWIGISGAAFSTGIGQNTSLGQSLLAAMVNLRLGYWWDSPGGRGQGIRAGFGDLVQRYMLREARAEYEGTHTNRWYLSDGGHYENTGVYELVRRRVALIIACDNGADPNYEFTDLVNLVRKMRIDFDAETEFLDRDALDQELGLDNSLRRAFGTLDDIRGHTDGAYATLARIRYNSPRDLATPASTLVLIKPRVGGSELPDLLRYKASNASFPQQPTTDQFFDEAQWESYYRLGQLIADTIFEPSSAGKLGLSGKQSPRWWPSAMQPLA